MLIRFFVRNLLSFEEEVEFSLVAGKGSLKPEHVIRSKGRNEIPILRSALIYGANASGKSNLIKALAFLQFMALKGPTDAQKEIPVSRFKLSEEEGLNSRLEVEIKVAEQYYAYGLLLNKKQIEEEWLYLIDKEKEEKIFERKQSTEGLQLSLGQQLIKNTEDQQFIQFVGRGTPKNKTFLKECIDRNVSFVPAITAVYNWFEHQLKIFYPHSKFRGIEFKLSDNFEFKQSISKLLQHFKTGVHSLQTISLKDLSQIQGIPAEVIEDVVAELEFGKRALISSADHINSFALEKDNKGELTAYKLASSHLHKSGKEILFELAEESDGTRRLIDFIPMLLDLQENNVVYLVDELDRSMHPILSKGLLSYFLAYASPQSQLIATTHESNLLDLKMFRKDEIWFIEKKKNSASKLYSLAAFKPRADKNIRKGYLLGRYGAIPFLANPQNLAWSGEE